MTRILALLVVLGALAELGAEAWFHARAPSTSDWKRAATFVKKRRKPADGISFAPAWVEPVGRLHFGSMLSLEEASRPDRARQSQVWEASIRDQSAMSDDWHLAEEHHFGRVRVRLYQHAAEELLVDFTELLAKKATLAEVDYRPVRCLPAPPPSILSFPDIPMGKKLAISTGIDDFRSRHRSSASVVLEVWAGHQRLARIEHTHEDGWKRSLLDTSWLAGSHRDIEFRISAERPRHRTFCFHAEIYR